MAFPYIAGLLSFRALPVIAVAWKNLSYAPSAQVGQRSARKEAGGGWSGSLNLW
ncbi:MAG: endonuclease V [Gemmatimonadaceae bacterium]